MIVVEDSFKWSHRIGFRSCTQKLELIAHKELSCFSHPERLASRTQSYPSCALQILIKLLPSYSSFKLPQYFERSMLYSVSAITQILYLQFLLFHHFNI